MRPMILILVSLGLLAGCTSVKETYYVDHEFGQANRAAWDQQIVHTDYRHSAKVPESLEGISAEEIMDVYNGTFAERPQDIDVFSSGIVE